MQNLGVYKALSPHKLSRLILTTNLFTQVIPFLQMKKLRLREMMTNPPQPIRKGTGPLKLP